VHPTNPDVIFASGATGIWKSENGGESWTVLLAPDTEFFWGIQIDPRAPDTLYAASGARQQLRLNDRQTFLRSLSGERQVAPGSLVSIYGRDLAETRTAASAPLPVRLGGASVVIGGLPAPLLFVSPDQINAQVPFGFASALMKRGQAPEAMRLWRDALERSPGLENARLSLAVAQYRTGDIRGAEAGLVKLLELNPSNTVGRKLLNEVRSRH
jgi:tetratricopeptide (TPR) repeat protein